MTTIPIVRLPHAVNMDLPSYATEHAAGMDLMAAIAEPVTIEPGKRAMIATGIAIALPEGFEAQVRPRSGLAANHGVTILNSPGTIDADYRGEIKAIMVNFGDAAFTVEPNSRIAQLIVAQVTKVRWETTESLAVTVRGDGGFGSTGSGLTGV